MLALPEMPHLMRQKKHQRLNPVSGMGMFAILPSALCPGSPPDPGRDSNSDGGVFDGDGMVIQARVVGYTHPTAAGFPVIDDHGESTNPMWPDEANDLTDERGRNIRVVYQAHLRSLQLLLICSPGSSFLDDASDDILLRFWSKKSPVYIQAVSLIKTQKNVLWKHQRQPVNRALKKKEMNSLGQSHSIRIRSTCSGVMSAGSQMTI
jgi:hypothetical protein